MTRKNSVAGKRKTCGAEFKAKVALGAILAGIGKWMTFYNTERSHSALGGRTPIEAHQGPGPKAAA